MACPTVRLSEGERLGDGWMDGRMDEWMEGGDLGPKVLEASEQRVDRGLHVLRADLRRTV